MASNHNNGMQCAEFAGLVAAALDQTLAADRAAGFAAHRAACPACRALYEETSSGLEWLQVLKAEPLEPPARLTNAILLSTCGATQPRLERQGWRQRLAANRRFASLWAGIRQPRFAMAFAMAFFSLSLLANITGFGMHDLAELRSGSILRAFGTAQGRVLKYYDNLRFVYEIESRVRDLKRAVPEEAPANRPAPGRQAPAKGDRDGVPGARRTAPDLTPGALARSGQGPSDTQATVDRRWL